LLEENAKLKFLLCAPKNGQPLSAATAATTTASFTTVDAPSLLSTSALATTSPTSSPYISPSSSPNQSPPSRPAPALLMQSASSSLSYNTPAKTQAALRLLASTSTTTTTSAVPGAPPMMPVAQAQAAEGSVGNTWMFR
jgi:hypothetical protein